ncbi:MAG TPA: pyridoxamine 5'-phosphate oxidase family protein [Candidatus Saccharimonadales bacterium]
MKHEKVHDFMRHHPMGVLSTVSGDGTPWGSAIYYVVDEDLNCYFVTRGGTQKYKNLETSPEVALTIVDSATQTTVQLIGKVTPLPVQEYFDIFFDKFAKLRPQEDLSWAPPIEKIHKGNFMPLKITPSHLQYANYGHQKSDAMADYIEKII